MAAAPTMRENSRTVADCDAGSDESPRRRAQVPLPELYRSVRSTTERLCAPLSAEDAVVQSMPDASPAKWHLAHATWFFETFVLERFLAGYAPRDPSYRVLFNSYYNAVGPMYPRPERGMVTRPSLAEVFDYRRSVDEAVERVLARGDSDDAVAEVVVLGINHEQQHQELILTDIKHVLSRNPLLPAYHGRAAPRGDGSLPLRWSTFDEGIREIGHAGPAFAFDNERPRHRVFVHAFEIALRPVTNGEYAAFIEDGAYVEPALWLSDGWNWVRQNAIAAPFYWQRHEGCWHEFTLAGLREIDPAAPVCHLSFYESAAFAKWAGARLPTEQEWEVAASSAPLDGNFADDGWLHPAACPAERMFGDVWQWTASAYAPYPGYTEPDGALGEYNGKFMSGQMVLRGGSCATPRSHVRATYRNFFYPDARWQFSGLRLARDC
jgi:ergothioneine biosynthesis protein EgtB